MSDPFENFLNDITSPAQRKRLDRVQSKAEVAKEKRLTERDVLMKRWHADRDKRKAELMKGDWKAPAIELVNFLDRMTMEEAPALIELVQVWRHADGDTRFQVQMIISDAIMYLRECEGLPPFDDPIPYVDDDEPNASMIIREILK
jgi:hypothetical protein